MRPPWPSIELSHVGVERHAEREEDELAVDPGDGAVAGRPAAQGTADPAQLEDGQRRARAGRGEREQRLDRVGRKRLDQSGLTDVWHRLLGALVQAHERRRRDHPEGVELRAERTQRRDQRRGGGRTRAR
jgi:hypothetical protein